MGTDLHGPLIEIGHSWGNSGKGKIDWWRAFAFYHWDSRNYLFFDCLAGVRGAGRNPIPVRGIPEDTDNVKLTGDLYKAKHGGDEDIETQSGSWLGYHDHTWLTPEEWESVVVAYRAACDDGDDPYPKDIQDVRNVDTLIKMARATAEKANNDGTDQPVRLIFGFDS